MMAAFRNPVGGPQPPRSARLARLLALHPELAEHPRWRLFDLPETHREAYRQLFPLDRDGRPLPDLAGTSMNAPARFSTCHQ
jgi:hypothetical protein